MGKGWEGTRGEEGESEDLWRKGRDRETERQKERKRKERKKERKKEKRKKVRKE